MNPELSGFVACGRGNPSLGRATDSQRLAAQLRIIPLLDGSLEGIPIDMDDLALSHGYWRINQGLVMVVFS